MSFKIGDKVRFLKDYAGLDSYSNTINYKKGDLVEITLPPGYINDNNGCIKFRSNGHGEFVRALLSMGVVRLYKDEFIINSEEDYYTWLARRNNG